MLIFKLDELQKFKNHPTEFDEELDLTEDLKTRDDRILDASPVKIKGHIFYDKGLWYTDFDVISKVTVPSTRSLEPVEIEISSHFTEAYQEDPDEELEVDDEEMVMELDEQGINLEQAAADNLLLSIPTRVLTKEEAESDSMPQGQNWKVVSEEEYEEAQDKPKPNPEFEKLKDLFKDK
ncbi:hypothetical protein RD055328_04410 [Companilactobacillus sp. RD055328]|uniref:YceD family protein n=1 Tax=Companilactobacillus sp. RD055328 TaxID=2916634 RepID=UPI001FC818BF|nr:YceD family protein [Companilactobacillus sp. RD055328]GKQ42518.1 hypothetical protein RD055328_04410 [Companilactobacillus sp. RD055328]